MQSLFYTNTHSSHCPLTLMQMPRCSRVQLLVGIARHTASSTARSQVLTGYSRVSHHLYCPSWRSQRTNYTTAQQQPFGRKPAGWCSSVSTNYKRFQGFLSCPDCLITSSMKREVGSSLPPCSQVHRSCQPIHEHIIKLNATHISRTGHPHVITYPVHPPYR